MHSVPEQVFLLNTRGEPGHITPHAAVGSNEIGAASRLHVTVRRFDLRAIPDASRHPTRCHLFLILNPPDYRIDATCRGAISTGLLSEP
jgi:hypothetical protein